MKGHLLGVNERSQNTAYLPKVVRMFRRAQHLHVFLPGFCSWPWGRGVAILFSDRK